MFVALQSLQNSGMAFIVKPHAINHGLVVAQAKQAGTRISLLRVGRYGSHFHKAEPKSQHGIRDFRIFIKASSKAQGIFKIQAEMRGCKVGRRDDSAVSTEARFQRLECEAMGRFSIHAMKERADYLEAEAGEGHDGKFPGN